MNSLSQKAVSGTIWMSVSNYLSFAIQFLGGIYLARMIAPQHFGEQGFAVAIISLVMMSAVWGIGSAIIKQQKDIEKYIGTILFIRVVSILLIGFLLLAISGFIYFKYDNLIALILLTILISQIPAEILAVYQAILQKQLLFKRMFFIQFAAIFLSMLFACLMAYQGFGVWALVSLLVSGNILTALLTFVLTPQRIKPCFDRQSALDFYHYGKYMFASSIMDRVYRQGDNFAIGIAIGTQTLGFYQRGYSTSEMGWKIVFGGLADVIGPVFSGLQSSILKLGQAFEIVASFVFRLSILFYLWLIILAPELIRIIYGEKWLPAVPFIRILTIYGVFYSVHRVAINIYSCTGRSRKLFQSFIIQLVFFLLGLTIAIYFRNAFGVAFAVDVGIIASLIFLLDNLGSFAQVDYKKIFFWPLFNAAFIAILYFLSKNLLRIENTYLNILVQSIYIVGFYSFSLLIVERWLLIETFKKTLCWLKQKQNTKR